MIQHAIDCDMGDDCSCPAAEAEDEKGLGFGGMVRAYVAASDKARTKFHMVEGSPTPGWYCTHCLCFNGDVKEHRIACRACDTPRQVTVRVVGYATMQLTEEQARRIEAKLDLLLVGVGRLLERFPAMSAQLTALQAQVAQNTSVEESAVTLIKGLSTQLQAAIAANAAGDTSALPALQAELASSASDLAAAITANTPAAPPASPAPAAPAAASGTPAAAPPTSP
jgi:hypothetical protein